MTRVKKISLVLILTLVLSTVLLPISASACSPSHRDLPTKREMATLNYMVESANATIELAVRIAQRTPYNDVDALLITVDTIAYTVFAYADSIGAEVVCEYTPYEIDGQTVMIDPIRVINIPSGK